MEITTNPVKGTTDFTPKEMSLIQKTINKIIEVYTRNGFNQIQTPILEHLNLLTKGDSGDNSKMMFKTIKRGEKLVLNKNNLTEADIVEEGLRYDLTVPLSRFYANNLNDLPKPFKAFQIGESFRAEKPQKGRDREFTQCDIDIFGESSNLGEIELLISAMQAYYEIGLENITIKVNDRRLINSLILNAGFKEEDIAQVLVEIDKLDKIGIDGVVKELEKDNYELVAINNLVNALQNIKTNGLSVCLKYGVGEEIITSLSEIINMLNKFAYNTMNVVFDVSIIRGQGYYTGTVFEVYYNGSNFSRAIGGGGRYDNMLNKYVNQSIPAVGFSVGLFTCAVLLMENNINKIKSKKKIVLLYTKQDTIENVLTKKIELQKEYDVCVMPEPKNYNNFIAKMSNMGYMGLMKLKELKLILFN